LVIFTAITVLAWTCFLNVHEQGHSQAFSINWWFWLAMTGLGLGATTSVKWVGMLTISWVGSLTALQLWVLLGDTKNVTPRLWFRHLFARMLCLIGVPMVFYMAMFSIHFALLVNPGEGDGFMSSEFQSTLNSKQMNDVPADVAFGSRVSIRHVNTQGGYLHSHASMYLTGSKQQQITLYPHKDENNLWMLENRTYPDGGVGLSGFENISPPVFIQNGAIIKLYHPATDKRLHSHDHRPPVTEAEWQNEVSGYGFKGFEGDANDYFRVEIVGKMSQGAHAKTRLRTIESKFRLIHILTGCALFSHKVKLPPWAFEQQEVTCAKQGTLPNSLWYIESNEHPQLGPDAERVNYRRPGFFGKFWELQKVMWKTNAGLVDSHAWDSRPWSWPILRRGINFWGRDHRQVYLMGNPVVWWASTAAVAFYVIFKGLAILRWQRGYSDYSAPHFRRFDYEIGVAALGWAAHYFPFFLMQRQLFLHHYLPALYFAVIVLCQIFDFFAFRIQTLGLRKIPIVGWVIAISLLALSAAVFGVYSPLTYGNPWTKTSCRQVKLLNSWDWDCNTFLDNYSDYEKKVFLATSGIPTAPTAAPAGPPVPPVQHIPNQPGRHEDGEKKKEDVTSAAVPIKPGADMQVHHEHVEYRDAQGNLLSPEQVKALEGNAQFETKYETRFRVIDQYGNEIEPGLQSPEKDIAGQLPVGIGSDTASVEKEEDTVYPPIRSFSAPDLS
jgi:dolichyl-phosphate-mannose-protein mannosyltransferase